MKKIFTLTMLLVLAMTVNAQETYRKSWDFTKWSDATVSNLKAEAAKVAVAADGASCTDNGAMWSDCEKTSGNKTYPISQDNCFWQTGKSDGGIELTANGVTIPETAGLTFTNSSARNLALAVNYGDCSSISGAGFGPYQGGSYLWLGGSKKDYFIIPGVAPGTKIKMGVESHKLSDARGVELYIVAGPAALTKGTKLTDVDGNAVTAPTVYTDQEWYLPAEIPATDVDKAAEDGTYNILVYNTNGCHIYYITVGDGDSPVVEEAKKVAYLGTADDTAFGMFDASVVDATVVETVPAIADLQENYDALVVGTGATAEQLQGVKDVIAFFPVVNTNPALYALYDVTTAVTEDLTVADATNAIFNEKEVLEHTADIAAVNLSGYFAADKVLASAGEAAAIHVHNAGRNAYYYIPLNAGEGAQDLYDVLSNAIVAASKTKRPVAAVGKPAIEFVQGNGVSTVSIKALNSTTIYYTVDGTDPTTSSPLYTEPFDLTADATVKAFATGDGYTNSEISSADVKIALQIAAPTIAVTREQGKSFVTITGAEGASLYFNFNGAKTAALSQAYTEPVELTEPTVIYALATAEGSLPSELSSQFVGIDGIDASNVRMDVLAHFDANETDWYINDAEILPNQNGSASAYYFWGKNAWSYYSTEVDHEEIVKDSEGNDSTVYIYKVDPEALKVVNPKNENGWVLKSQGQVLTGELQLAPADGVGNGATGRYFEEASDIQPAGVNNTITKGVITFGAKTSGEPYTGRIETTGMYAGPFDVVVYCGNGNSGGKGILEIQVSADGVTWTSLGELQLADTQRYIKRTKASYEDAAEVYVRVAQTGGGTKAQVYDIYLLNNGEQSKQYSEETVGISNAQSVAVRQAAIYNLNGVRQQSLKRGLNIIVGADGAARKVMVK